jgi:hypothetical protein
LRAALGSGLVGRGDGINYFLLKLITKTTAKERR